MGTKTERKKIRHERPTKRERPRPNLGRVYEHIRNRILTLELPPGKILSEINFVKELHVSRTPVREALIRLAAEGLVEIHQNRGFWVSDITLFDIRHFFEALDVSQRTVTRLAALRFDPKSHTEMELELHKFERHVARGDVHGMNESNRAFHAVIADNCANALIKDHYLKLLDIGTRVSHLALHYEKQHSEANKRGGLDQIVDEHKQMMHFVVTGQADEAERIARSHVVQFRRRVLEFIATDDSARIMVTE